MRVYIVLSEGRPVFVAETEQDARNKAKHPYLRAPVEIRPFVAERST